MEKIIHKVVKLKDYEILEKGNYIYFISPSDKSVIMQVDKSFKWFPDDCFKKQFVVANADCVITKEDYERLKVLFEEVDV